MAASEEQPKAVVSTQVDSGSQYDPQLRAIAYSLDVLIPGFYLWLGPIKLRLGGSDPEENYPGMIHSAAGIALVLPGYRIYSTYHDSYDPR
jgi:hypothetical protein